MQKSYNDADFGEFKYDERMEWYLGQINLATGEVDICLAAEDEESFKKSLATLHELYNKLSAIGSSAKDFAVAELLDAKNSTWQAEGESNISAAEFKERISLESIVIGSGATVEFFYDDDGLFFDHAILLTYHVGENAGWVSAEIAD